MTTTQVPDANLLTQLAAALLNKRWRLATAESCTGGMIAAACTDLAGSSGWFDRGFVTYSNEAKHDCLGVPMVLIEAHGAVSEPVALAMARGALAHSLAQVAVAVTGIAGPTGGSPDKPVGTVWLAWAQRAGEAFAVQCHFEGDRAQVRQATVEQAIRGLLAVVTESNQG